MKFNGIDFDTFTNQELVQLCIKYNLVNVEQQVILCSYSVLKLTPLVLLHDLMYYHFFHTF